MCSEFLKQYVFLSLFRSLEGLESSGKLVGFISTTPGTYESSWCRVTTENPDRVGKLTSEDGFLNFEIRLQDFKVFDLRFGSSTPKSRRGQILR